MPSRARRVVRRIVPERVRRILRKPVGSTAVGKNAADATPPTDSEVVLAELQRGGVTADAVVATTRSLLAEGKADTAISVGELVGSDLGRLAQGIVAADRGFPGLAWSLLEDQPLERWSRLAPDEYLRSGLSEDPATALAYVRRLVDAPPAGLPASAWLAMIGPVFGYGDQQLAARLFEVFDRVLGDGADADRDLIVNRDWLRPWISASPDGRTAPPVAEGAVSFAVMDYGHPGRARASANIGDHVQSLASLGHLVRHQGLSYTGPQDLVDLAQQLRGRVRAEMQRDDVTGTVELLQVDRDASMYATIPPNTWTLAFGWFMHPIFDMRYGFPFHQNLLPIFVSFHCSKRQLLTDEAIEYLRRFAPIGCRDWTTVDVLLSVDVPAFFSGCMTTTVSTVFPDSPVRPEPDAPVAYVDMPAEKVPAGAPTYQHSADEIRFRTFTTNVYDAVDLLETYRREHSGLVTSRLHCYLPGRSIGVPVDFQPGNRSDPRFAGLIDITDAEFEAIRTGISDKLEQVLGAAFSGAAPEDVYALWRDLTADEVATARRRRDEQRSMPAAHTDLMAELSPVAASLPTEADSEDTVHVAVTVPAGRRRVLRALVASIAEHASRPVHLWMVWRAEKPLDVSGLERPGLTVTVVRTRGLGADVRRADGSSPAGRDLDRLVLPDLLAAAGHAVERLVWLPVDAVVTADVAELAGLDLHGQLIAAPTVVGTRSASGFGILHAAGNRLRNHTVAAAELRRRAHARHRFDFDAYNVDVLVIDGTEWRRRQLVSTYVPFIEEFGLSFREILHFEVGPDREIVPERWHVVPTRSAMADPALVHWADRAKPWTDPAVPGHDLWRAAVRAG